MTEPRMGKSICLFGDSGSGKSTQIGQLAKRRFKEDGKKTWYVGMDKGGFGSIQPLVTLGVLIPHLLKEDDDVWKFLSDAASGVAIPSDVGVVAFDSGTSGAEALLASCARLAAHGEQIGGRPAPKFTIGKGADALRVGTNVDSHYLVVQSFMLDVIWKSTWLTHKGIDVIWTFGMHRGEKEDATTILGPKLAGKALTPHMPKWFNLTFMIQSIPVEGAASRHVLSLQEQPVLGGTGMSFGNPRYPMEATTPIPATVEPANLGLALDLIRNGELEAEEALRAELGL